MSNVAREAELTDHADRADISTSEVFLVFPNVSGALKTNPSGLGHGFKSEYK